MTRAEYRAILGQLPIKCPTPTDMAMLCPHLTPKQAVKAFAKGNGYVACPSLRVHGAYQVLQYQRERVEVIRAKVEGGENIITARKNHPAQIHCVLTGRTRQSYTSAEAAKCSSFFPTPCLTEAIRFAEANWGSELVVDNWASALQIYVQDPTELVNDRYHRDQPRTKAVLYIMLVRELNEIINDYSRPESELYDDMIAEMTLDEMEWYELKGGRGGYTHFNCAHCAGGLLLSSCSSCGHRFQDDHYRCGYYTPLSRKMVNLLRSNGHIFGIDPEVVWTAERTRLEKARAAWVARKA